MNTPTDYLHKLLDLRLLHAIRQVDARRLLSHQEQLLLLADSALDRWNIEQIAQIASVLHPESGKLLYSNAEKRSAVLYQIQDQDPAYPPLLDAVLQARRDMAATRRTIEAFTAAIKDIDERTQWAHGLLRQPTSISLLTELLEATMPPPFDWPGYLLDSSRPDSLVPVAATIPEPNN
jgi:hypothetical protein